MTREQFDNYRFSIKTGVKIDDEWFKILAIDFEEHSVIVDSENADYVECSEIEGIREGKND